MSEKLIFSILATFLCSVSLLFLITTSGQVTAVSGPLNEATQITAGVHDTEPPSTPILIAPVDGKKLTINKPTFVWTGSTDNFEVTNYRLELNSAVKFDLIPLVDDDNANYTLTYDSLEHEYSLTVKTALSDGSYNWNIVAVDIQDNEASSVIWDFTIDTQAPSFTITDVGDTEVEISAGDSESVPSDPIELTENEPKLSGTGEANSTVKLTLDLPGDDTEEYNFTIGGDGNWSVTLNSLPRDQTIYMDFLITDPSGNVSLLDNVPLKILSETIVITIPITPTEPVIIEPFGTIIPSKVPTPTPTQVTILIPKVPVKELLPPVITRTIPKKVVYYIRTVEATARTVTIVVFDNIWWLSILAMLLFLPLLKLWLLTIQYWNYMSLSLFRQFLWLIGWLPDKPPQGIIISEPDQTAIGYSLVTVSGKTAEGLPYKQQVISNQAGVFPDLKLEAGKYRISTQHPQYLFPTLKKAPAHLDWNTYYTGSEFTVQKDDPSHLLVLVAEPTQYSRNTGAQMLRQQILGLPSLSLPLAVLASSVTIYFPNIWNIALMVLYFGLYAKKIYQKKRKNFELDVVDTQKLPRQNVVLSWRNTKDRTISKIMQTDAEGKTMTWLKNDSYLLWAIDIRAKLTEGDKKSLTTLEKTDDKDYRNIILQAD